MASGNKFYVNVVGKGGHAALPQTGIDPVPIACEIVQAFQAMRAEQRGLASKITELQGEMNEHKIVIETLDGVDPDRKCFR